MDCHFDGIIAKRDQLRDIIDNSPTFSIAQRELLLELYVDQDTLAKTMARDRDAFISALEKIGVTEKAPDGTLKSKGGPGKEEIITWYADLYEDDVDYETLAAEFDMTPAEFEIAVQRIDDGKALRLALDWITQLKGGSKVPRFEVEQQFPKMVKALLDVDPLETKATEEAKADTDKKDAKSQDGKEAAKDKDGKEAAKDKDPKTPAYKDADYRDDAFKDADAKDKLTLAINVKNTDVFVDEKLSFEVTANRACELQIFYVEEDGNVETIPQEMIGAPNLDAGKARLIPDPASGDLVFDTPAANETLLLFCREGGLGDKRMSAEEAKKLAKDSGEPASRGLAVKLFEKAKADEKLADAKAGGDAKEGGKGTSAIQMVSFNVKERK